MPKFPTFVLFLAACAGSLHAASPLLVENGAPRAEIVMSTKPARMARLAAKELQTYGQKIRGARMEITPKPRTR